MARRRTGSGGHCRWARLRCVLAQRGPSPRGSSLPRPREYQPCSPCFLISLHSAHGSSLSLVCLDRSSPLSAVQVRAGVPVRWRSGPGRPRMAASARPEPGAEARAAPDAAAQRRGLALLKGTGTAALAHTTADLASTARGGTTGTYAAAGFGGSRPRARASERASHDGGAAQERDGSIGGTPAQGAAAARSSIWSRGYDRNGAGGALKTEEATALAYIFFPTRSWSDEGETAGLRFDGAAAAHATARSQPQGAMVAANGSGTPPNGRGPRAARSPTPLGQG